MAVRDYNLIIQRTAKKLDIPEYEVWKVMKSICQYIGDLIESGENKGFYMRFLGKLYVKTSRIESKLRKEKLKEDVRVSRSQDKDKSSNAEHS